MQTFEVGPTIASLIAYSHRTIKFCDIINLQKICNFYYNILFDLMEHITLRLDSTNEVKQWYIRHNK